MNPEPYAQTLSTLASSRGEEIMCEQSQPQQEQTEFSADMQVSFTFQDASHDARMLKKDRGRRKRQPEEWQKNVKKRNRATNHSMGEDCRCKRFKCFEEKTTEEDRQILLNVFNQLGDYNKQQAYLASLIDISETTNGRGESRSPEPENAEGEVQEQDHHLIEHHSPENEGGHHQSQEPQHYQELAHHQQQQEQHLESSHHQEQHAEQHAEEHPEQQPLPNLSPSDSERQGQSEEQHQSQRGLSEENQIEQQQKENEEGENEGENEEEDEQNPDNNANQEHNLETLDPNASWKFVEQPKKKQKLHTYTTKYHLKLSNSRVRVCQKAFCSIFGITAKRINLLASKLYRNGFGLPPVDQRGKHVNRGSRYPTIAPPPY